ncbi:metallophosphoesterase family protein [Desulfosarcina ovata]|uniref:Phosphoesterase n=1 Tax=Desulfosarcina ovata subsp. ovata TaxID=2752305 RepID=A0A5K8A5P6_9BACT|nr:metallophosphoesterase family protein [Desulfosarcina ovata]BBO87776.1 phosphoesterase [Desulfosarcina ovata subsp. ovata]
MNTTNATTTIGVLSDTHGLVRPEVEKALAGCDRLLHAGDVGDADVLKRLERIAPVVAVRGNTDHGSWAEALPAQEMVEIEGVFFYILHDRCRLDLEPSAAGIHVVVSGHTHQPELVEKNGVVYLNPGSAGHRRYDYPVSVAIVRIENGTVTPKIVEIQL